MPKFRRYKKGLDYSYTLGISPTLELLKASRTEILSIYLSSKSNQSKYANEIRRLGQKLDIPLQVNDKLINNLSPSSNCYSIGVFKKYISSLKENENHLVLVNPSDTGNLGTIIRTMVGFNINNLAIIKPGVDIFDPKTIRASMGALFNINFSYFNSLEEYTTTYKNNLYTFYTDGSTPLKETEFKSPFSLVFGNEGDGLDLKYKNISKDVSITFSSKIDSLNLSVSVGIAIYEATKNSLKR